MMYINQIERKIKELEGGIFQKLCNAYLLEKYSFISHIALGSQEGSNKTTVGIPDTIFINEDKYIYAMYGTNKSIFNKLMEDIKNVKLKINKDKLDDSKVDRIICCHSSSNLSVEQIERLRKESSPYDLEIIGINDMAYDLSKIEYHGLARDFLGVSVSTEQVFSIDEFIKVHDKSKTNAPLSNKLIGVLPIDSNQFEKLKILLISDRPGTGKTKLAIELCKELEKSGSNVIFVKGNNQNIYYDVKYYLKTDTQNIIFIDDINTILGLEATLGLLNLRDNITFILTVRSYALREIINTIEDYNYLTIKPSVLNSEELNDLILQFSKRALPQAIVDKILIVAHNNPRMAVKATKLCQGDEFSNQFGEKDVMVSYYERVIKESEISEIDKKVLFVLSFFKKVRIDTIDDNPSLIQLLELMEISKEVLKNSIYSLGNKEIVEVHKHKIVKIIDQSFDDYIVLHFLSNEIVKVNVLLDLFYKIEFRNIVTILNQIICFCNKQFMEKIEDTVRGFYMKNNASHNFDNEKFLITFSPLLQNETLQYIKNQLEKSKKENYEQCESPLKIVNVKTPELIMINNLASTENDLIALQLLFKIFNTNPNKINEIYSILIENYSLYSDGFINFVRGIEILRIIERLNFDNIATHKLIVTVVGKFLKLELSQTVAVNEVVQIRKYIIPETSNLIVYHCKLLEILKQIYQIGENNIKKRILKSLREFKYTIQNYATSHRELIEKNLSQIEKLFFDNENLSFDEEDTLYQLYKSSIENGFNAFQKHSISKNQEKINILKNERYAWISNDEDKENLRSIARIYESEWNSFFELLANNKDEVGDTIIVIENVLFNLFINSSVEGKLKFLQNLLLSHYTFSIFSPRRFLKEFEIADLKSNEFLQFFSEHSEWELGSMLLNKEVDKDSYLKVFKLISNNTIPKYYSIFHFENYIKFNKELLNYFLNNIENIFEITFFIPSLIRENECNCLIEILGESFLKMNYIKYINLEIDSSRCLFFHLGKNDKKFVFNVLKRITENRCSDKDDTYIISVIEKIPGKESIFKDYLEYVIKNNMERFNDYANEILDNHPLLLNDLLNCEAMESEAVKILNLGVEKLKGKEEICNLFKLFKNKGFGKRDFEKIQFIWGNDSWTGSYIPILELKIDTISKIKEIFKYDFEYIDLVCHLDKLVSNLNREIEKEAEREFLYQILK